jgi:hypothetical protein
MLLPSILSRVEQATQSTRFGINARDIRAFVAIAAETAQGKIIQRSRTAVLSRNNVVNLER